MNPNLATPRNYLILGASGEIGSHVAKSLSARGHEVFLASRHSDRLRSLSEELQTHHSAVDATRIDQVEACFQNAFDRMGRLDGAVNCVGSVLLKPAHLTSEADWNQTVAANLTSAFATVRGSAKTMKAPSLCSE